MRFIKCKDCFNYRNEWCEKVTDSPDPDKKRDCDHFRHMTNGDRIRAMTDEELAELLCTVCSCYGCKARTLCDGDEPGCECNQIIEKWLKQPAEEEV